MTDPLEHTLEEELAHVSRRSAWLVRICVMALCFLAAYVIVQLIGQIDWEAVWHALGHLDWWQLVVLLVPLLFRQILNALPLAFFIHGLSVYRAVVNDLAAHLLAVVAPPPGDMVMRVGMFRSWGIDASLATAGTLMNTIAFYIMRFAAPIVGFLILLPIRFDSGYASSAAFGAAAAGTLAVLVILALRSDVFAERLGRTAGTMASKVRRSIHPETWATAFVRFRLDMKGTFGSGFPRSAVALLGLVFVDATILLLSLRFVGIPASELPSIELYAAFLCAYPLTLFPFMGLGIVDAVLLATIVETAGLDAEPLGVAALVVWRIFTLAGPVALGAVSMGLWKHSARRQGFSTAASG